MSGYKVTLQNGVEFFTNENETILAAAQREGFLLEHSCKIGRCGACKVQLLNGSTASVVAETSLSVDEKLEKYILTCCRTISSDIELATSDLSNLEIIEPRKFPAKIDSISQLSDHVLGITLRIPPSSKLKFLSGQYLNVRNPDGITRSYSIASTPDETSKLEIFVARVPGGLMSEYWFSNAKIDDLLIVDGPFGTFSLRETSKRTLIFLATGTGIAPFKSMIENEANREVFLGFDQIILYWGLRYRGDLCWHLTNNSQNIEFVVTLSKPDEPWRGRSGYVQDVLLADKPSFDDAVIYACGSEQMIKSSRKLLLSAGLDSAEFHSDAFVCSANLGEDL